jgi:Fic family protein
LNAKNKAIYNKTALENARQSDTIIDLKDSLEKNKEEITNLNNTINGKNNKIIILEKDLQHENRKKKVSTLTNFVRWIGS